MPRKTVYRGLQTFRNRWIRLNSLCVAHFLPLSAQLIKEWTRLYWICWLEKGRLSLVLKARSIAKLLISLSMIRVMRSCRRDWPFEETLVWFLKNLDIFATARLCSERSLGNFNWVIKPDTWFFHTVTKETYTCMTKKISNAHKFRTQPYDLNFSLPVSPPSKIKTHCLLCTKFDVNEQI